MSAVETILARMRAQGNVPALYWNGQEYSYAQFIDLVDSWGRVLGEKGIGAGTVCAFLGDYSPQACALMYALMEAKAILVPLTRAVEREMAAFQEIAGIEVIFRFDTSDNWVLEQFPGASSNDLVSRFRSCQEPGLIVFTSGSTGKPKGILHNCERVMRKFIAERPGWKTVLFLMMDHFGGFNTLLSTFAYGGMAVCLAARAPEAVCETIGRSSATLLPTTPTFLNLLLTSGSYRNHDLSSVRLITYGTELMPESTLQKVRTVFPNAQIKQTYGLSELGVLRSKSESDDSLWVKIGGDGFEVKVVDNLLWVRSEANMVGYLNAPDPFDADGWMCTGDYVEVNGEYLRFLGRKSEIINVGGQKVFPVEVETVLLQAENVRETTVYGVPHSLMGQVVHARVSLAQPEAPDALAERLRKFCLERLARFKVPMRFVIVSAEGQRSERFKKNRQFVENDEVV